MRLVDADALIECLEKEKQRFKGEMYSVAICMIENTIKRQPTAYDVEKVVADIKEYANSNICWKYDGCPYRDMPSVHCENCGALGALDIVRKGGVE